MGYWKARVRWVFIKVEAKLCRTTALQDWRWPSLAYTNFTAQHPDNMGGVTNAWRLFIKELVKELVLPHMKRCLEGRPHLQNHITVAMGRCGIKTKHSHHLATGIHQPGGSIKEEEVQDLPICQRQTSHQLVFSVRPVCKEHKPVVVICEACKHWDGSLRWCCTCVILFC